jgi:hypothetical protein
VTPTLLRAADELCPRRLRAEFVGDPGSRDPVNRGRLRDALLDSVRTWHATGTRPDPPTFLEHEEQRVLEHALGWYEQLFGLAPLRSVDRLVEEPTLLPRRDVRLGGWVDLCVEREDGTHELRQLSLSGRPMPADPLELEPVRLAVLRLATLRWVEDGPLVVGCADLLVGDHQERVVRLPGDVEPIAGWLDARLEIVRRRAAEPVPEPGRDCTWCRFVPGCPPLGVRGSMITRKGDLLPGVLAVSPTALDTWRRCRREWRNRVLLALPASDADGGTTHGRLLHQLLRLVHERGSCHDAAHVDDVLDAHRADDRTRDEVRRHIARCPTGAEVLGHEVEWVRAHARPPVFVASARLDAVWAHDGVVEVRDYKTGAVPDHALGDDRRAWLQAWVVAPVAEARGARVRIRYEYLAQEVPDDPEPWEPDAEDLARIEAELVREVTDMRAEREWRGIQDANVCRTCRYRSICPDSAAPSEPAWPAVRADEPEGIDEVEQSLGPG